jgi:hypothetical protein
MGAFVAIAVIFVVCFALQWIAMGPADTPRRRPAARSRSRTGRGGPGDLPARSRGA